MTERAPRSPSLTQNPRTPAVTWEGRAPHLTPACPPAADSARPSAIPEDSRPDSGGLEAIVTVTETLEELRLPPEAAESESRGAIYSIPIPEDGGGGSSTPEDPAETPGTLLGNSTPHPRARASAPERLGAEGQLGAAFMAARPCPVRPQRLRGARPRPATRAALLFQQVPRPALWVRRCWTNELPLGRRGPSSLVSPPPTTYPKETGGF